MDALPFIVRAWPVNMTSDPVDFRAPTLLVAMAGALGAAMDRRYRSVYVTDDQAMIWASFNMLWGIPGVLQ